MRTLRLAVPDLVSPSYFPAIAMVDRIDGIEIALELRFPVTDAARALAAGEIDLLAGAAHAGLYGFPDWSGLRLLGALSRGTYWFLVIRADLFTAAGELEVLRGLRIGAAPGVDVALRTLLADEGIEVATSGITIMPLPKSESAGSSFGVGAAEALAAGAIDAFWANGMGARIAVDDGVGKVLVDARRDGKPYSSYTFPALMTTHGFQTAEPELTERVTRALAETQQALYLDPEQATGVGERWFPPREATLIAGLVQADAPYYATVIGPDDLAHVMDFARRSGLTDQTIGYDDLVPANCAPLWWRGPRPPMIAGHCRSPDVTSAIDSGG